MVEKTNKNPIDFKNVVKSLPEIDRNLILPQMAFSGKLTSKRINILYISDLHLPEHLSKVNIKDKTQTNEIKLYLDKIIKNCIDIHISRIASHIQYTDMRSDIYKGYYTSFKIRNDLSETDRKYLLDSIISKATIRRKVSELHDCVCFIGDISYDSDLVDLLFKRLNLRLKYHVFLKWKSNNIKHFTHTDAELYKSQEDRIENITQEIKNYRKRIAVIEQKTGKKNLLSYYEKKDSNDIERLVKAREDLPDHLAYLILKVKKLKKIKHKLSHSEYVILPHKDTYINSFSFDYPEHCPFFYILGNHELSQYHTIEEATEKYKEILEKYDVKLLHNGYVSYENCILLGGTAFAKNNERFNADTVIGPGIMSGNRNLEAAESDRFNKVYQQALKEANKKNIPLVVLTHYPVSDWISEQVSPKCYYFHGHNHKNRIEVNEKCHIYADNQIGYTDTDITLKSVELGTSYNPFYDYKNGYYTVTPEQYSDFYIYSGEFIETNRIRDYIEKGHTLYMVKQNDFYGFFLIRKNTKICYGGSFKNISKNTDIEHFYSLFSSMISIYLKAMVPLRDFQEKIASDIQTLGLPTSDAGRIHGTIIDVDFCHHIMLNPFDGSITYYYSPSFGIIKKFGTIKELLTSVIEKTKHISKKEEELILEKINSLPKDSAILTYDNDKSVVKNFNFERIDIKNSLYAVSSKVNQLQRLFTANILRDWNEELVLNFIKSNELEGNIVEEKLRK